MENSIGGLIVDVEARIDKLEKGLNKANTVQRRANSQFERRANQSASRIRKTYGEMGDSVGAGFKKMAVPLLAGVASVQTVRQIAATTRAVAQLGDEAKRSGVGLETFQEWKFVAEQNRIGVDSLVDGLKELSIRGDEFAVTGKGAGAEAFARLGFGADQLKDKLKDPSNLMLEIIGRMERLSKSGQIRVADEIFGGSAGERFVELIDQGEDGLRKTIDRAHDLGLVLDDSVVARADELDRKFNALLSKVSTLGKKIAVGVADIGAQIADDVVGNEPDPLAPLTRSFKTLEDRARLAGTSMLQSIQQLNAWDYGETVNSMRDLGNRTLELVDAFAKGEIEGQAFADELQQIQDEAARAFDKVDSVDRAEFPNVIASLGGLKTQLGSTTTVAVGLKSVLDEINGTGGPSQLQVFREADAQSMANFEADQKRRAEFNKSETTRNAMSRERLDLEKEITSVQKRAADAGVNLTKQQATAAAQARITADAARRAANTPDRPASTSGGGGGGAASVSNFDAELTSIAEETAALRLEAIELDKLTGAQLRNASAMDLARTKADLLSAAQQSGVAVTPALRAQIDTLAAEYIKAGNAADLAADKITEVQNASKAGAQSIADVFIGMATGALSAKDAVGQLIIQVLKLSLQKRLLETAENAGGWLGKIIGVVGGGFAEGGFTGQGGKYQPAGVVHKGEYVMSKAATSAIGVGNLERMHSAAKRGYADGGLVGRAANSIGAPTGNSGGSMGAISISAPITVNGSAGTPEQNADLSKKMAREMEGSMRGVVVDELRRQMRNGNMLSNGGRR